MLPIDIFNDVQVSERLKKLKSQHSLEEPKDKQGHYLLATKLLKATAQRPFLVGGIDLSEIIGSKNTFICGYTVYAVTHGTTEGRPNLMKVYSDARKFITQVPYRPGFLGFKESGPMVNMVQFQISSRPSFKPDVILIDGNGILHPKKFGSACHVGVALGIPTIGVGKSMHFYPALIQKRRGLKEYLERMASKLENPQDKILIENEFDETVGVMFCPNVAFIGKPLYISQGHKVSLDTAVQIVEKCIRSDNRRLPEPIFDADLLSRKMAAELSGNGVENWTKFVRYHRELDTKEKAFWVRQYEERNRKFQKNNSYRNHTLNGRNRNY